MSEQISIEKLKAALAGVYEYRSSMWHDDWGNTADEIDRWYQEAVEKALGGNE